MRRRFVNEVKKGPLPAIDRALGGANSSLATLIEQSGVRHDAERDHAR